MSGDIGEKWRDRCTLLLYFLLTILHLAHFLEGAPDPVDVALGKNVTAQFTCGELGLEYYYSHSQIFVSPVDRRRENCTDATYHPPNAMTDGDTNTWWQSTSRGRLYLQPGLGEPNPEVVFELDLDQVFSAERVVIQMGESLRPLAMAVMKSTDGTNFIPWAYKVQDESECSTRFRTTLAAEPLTPSGTSCSTYEISTAMEYENITFYFRDFPPSLNDWKKVRYLRIQFYKLELELSPFADQFYHYTVSRLEVWAECTCNDLQTDCQKNNVSGSYECVCGGNAAGSYCERCQPLYNQEPYSYGKDCQVCECNNHASSCYYNTSIAALNLSVDAAGNYSGGGVCTNCDGNTTGINCEKCNDFFFRSQAVVQSDINACQPCGCNESGVITNLATGLTGDCIMNDDAPLPLNKIPGDCFCKENVEGTKCNKCKPGFYNLDLVNPNGCQACHCYTPGTINGSTICNGDAMGQCPCKTFTSSRSCFECSDGFYGLEANNSFGCTPCDCDVGGSVSPVCDKNTGQCLCRSNIGGRQCNEALDGFYASYLNFITGEFETLESPNFSRVLVPFYDIGYLNLGVGGVAVETNFTVPPTPIGVNVSGDYLISLRYSARLQVTGNVVVNQAGKEAIVGEVNFLPTSVCLEIWCYVTLGQTISPHNLNSGDYTINVNITERSGNEFLIDRVVVIPYEFYNTSKVLGENYERFNLQCDVMDNGSPRNGTNSSLIGPTQPGSCESRIFSIVTQYFNGALACNCDLTGSVNNTCNKYGGQCPCKPGVGGRTCDVCLLEYFGFSQDGCTACSCAGTNPICDFTTGQCQCSPNTESRTCDSCVANYWNWRKVEGCQDCLCNNTGSTNLQCNLTAGVCDCQPGVSGEKCNQCMNGYKDFSVTGCVDCGCDQRGSVNSTCDAIDGQCPCKASTESMLCDTCIAGSFDLSTTHENGCLDCICMGITSNCDSIRWFKDIVHVPVSENTLQAFNLVETGNQNISRMLQDINGIQYIQANLSGSSKLYWQHPSQFSGNFLERYGSEVNFTIIYSTFEPGHIVSDNSAILLGRNDVTLFQPVLSVAPNSSVTLTLGMTESDWLLNTTSNQPLTRGEFLLAISDVKKLSIPALYFTGRHQVSFGAVTYTTVSNVSLSGLRQTDVEECQCGVGYTGLSCQNCAYGYKRMNVSSHSYLGECVPCDCNGHSDYCAPDTGICVNCLHNSTGSNCEICMNGYYGDATQGTSSDCTSCPCYEPRVVNNTCTQDVNGTVQCSYCGVGYTGNLCDSCEPFFWGNPTELVTGTCTHCDCNANSQQCNETTGECLDCSYNTTGYNCQWCRDGFFGDASLQSCQECNCILESTVNQSSICNHTSGQCDCLPGVGNRTCDGCMPNYWGYAVGSITGCIPCTCNADGSETLQCDDIDGHCTCRTHAGGYNCSQCAPGLWGLPVKPCTNCSCDSVGSVNYTEPCDLVTGQCQCKVGVSGRTCDQCDFMHYNFTSAGCTECGSCQKSVGRDAKSMQSRWEGYWTTTNVISQLHEQDMELQAIQTLLNDTLWSLGFSANRLSNMTLILTDLTSQEGNFNNTVKNFIQRVNTALQTSQSLQSTAAAELIRVQYIQSNASLLHGQVVSAKQTADAMIALYESWITEGNRMLADSSAINSQLGRTFGTELQLVAAEAAMLRNTTDGVTRMENLVVTEDEYLRRLEDSSRTMHDDLKSLNQTSQDVMFLTESVNARRVQSHTVFNQSLQNMAYAERLFAEAVTLLNITTYVILEAERDYAVAVTSFGEALANYEGRDNSGYRIYTERGNANGAPCVFPFIYQGVTYTQCIDVDFTVLWCATTSNFDSDSLWGHCIITPTLPSITGWLTDAAILESLINQTRDSITSNNTYITQSEQYTQLLTLQAQNILREFQSVESRGQRAVDAITNYETVAAMLNESLTLAVEANKTVMQALNAVERVTVSDLEAQANTSRALSGSTLFRAEAKIGTPSVVNMRLVNANSSLQSSISQWQEINAEMVRVQDRVNNIQTLMADQTITQLNFLGQQTSNEVTTEAQKILTETTGHRQNLTSQNNLVAVIQTTVNNVSVLMTEITNSFSQYNTTLNNVQSTVTQMETLKATTDQLRQNINNKMATVQAKLARAKLLAENLEQPVRFYGNASVTMANPQVSSLSSEIALELGTQNGSMGLLFFVEDPATGTELSLQLVNGSIVYRFNLGSGVVELSSLANICDGCWFKVVATRYKNAGQLTVTRLDTGGTAVSSADGGGTNNVLVLSNQFYIAGLPTSYQTDKVTNNGFIGCIHNLEYNHQLLHLWQEQRIAGYTSCCAQPPSVAPTTMSGTSFDGFGYLQLNLEAFDVSIKSQVMLQHRTFSTNAVLLLVDQPGSTQYYGIYLVDGHLLFQYGSQAGNHSIKSDKVYNTGSWFETTVLHNETYAMLYIRSINGTQTSQSEFKFGSAPQINLTQLTNGRLFIGGQTTDVVDSPGPNSSFAGCINTLQLSGSTSPLTRRLLNESIAASQDISLSGCYPTVAAGIRFTSRQAFAQYRTYSTLRNLQAVSFDFATTDPNGILVYTEDPAQQIVLYLALTNGNLYLQYSEGSSTLIEPAITLGQYFADGVLHRVTVDLSGARAYLTVDDYTIQSSQPFTSGIHITDSNSFLSFGGVRDDITLNNGFPLKRSFIGGIANIQVNYNNLPYMDMSVLSIYRDISLAGFSAPRQFSPPLPYTTTTPIPTTAAPTCAPPAPLQLSPTGVRFGDFNNSHMAFDIGSNGDAAIFTTSFVITVEFRALTPNGIILYAADQNINPEYWLALFIEDGHLVFSMQTSSRSDSTKNIKSLYTYDDGNWWEVQVLRINDFIAQVVTARRDYVNNKVSSVTGTTLTLGTSLCVGGLESLFVGAFPLSVGKIPFRGCIKKVEVNMNDLDKPRVFDLSNPNRKAGVTQCYNDISPGVSLGGNGYVTVVNQFQFVLPLVFSFGFRATNNSANLLAVYRSPDGFFTVDMYNGQIRVTLGNSMPGQVNDPFMAAVSAELTRHIICDNQEHSIAVELNTNGVSVTVDNNLPESYAFPQNFALPLITGLPLHAGGLADPGVIFPVSISNQGLKGCLTYIAINGQSYYYPFEQTSNAVLGCSP